MECAGCKTSGWKVAAVGWNGGAARCNGGAYPGVLLAWIPKNSPQSWIALVIKKLSKQQNLTQFD